MSLIKEIIVKIVSKNKYTSAWYNKYIDSKTIKYLENLIKKRSRKYNPKVNKSIYLLLEPEHDNIGDHAIAYVEEKFLENTIDGYNIFYLTEREYKLYKKYLRKIIKKNDLIFLHGGGNLGDLYLHHEILRREVIETFVNNKIILFPQTIDFSESENGRKELAKTIEIYSKHKNLVLIAREKESYEKMSNLFNNKILLTPDIVLFWDDNNINNNNRCGALMCFRNDEEKVLADDKIRKIKSLLKVNYTDVKRTDMRAGRNIYWSDRKEILKDKIKEFLNVELVVTDRLHGMIIATITSTPCIVFKNSNHKIIGTYNQWLKDIKYIKYVDDVNELEKRIEELKNIKNEKYTNKKFYAYYRLISNEC